MRRLLPLTILVVLVTACGGSSPTSPSVSSTNPTPTPTPAPTTGTLSGQVRNQLNASVAGATVTVLDGGGAGRSAATDGNGRYTFAGLPLGSVTLSVTAPGYEESRAAAP